MIAFLFKTKPAEPELDVEFEMAKLAMADRLDQLMAKDISRKLRFATLSSQRH